jgi:hypothetical protein
MICSTVTHPPRGCRETASKPSSIHIDDLKMATVIANHQKAIGLFPNLSQSTVIDGLTIPDCVLSFDLFSTGQIAAKMSGWLVLKDKETHQLYTVWQRVVVGHNITT